MEPLSRSRQQALTGPDKSPRAAAQAAEKAQAKLDDALTVYLNSTLEPAQKAYNQRYVCDYPLGLAGLEQYRAQHESLVRIDWSATPPAWSRRSGTARTASARIFCSA